jgi:hypothetical protein
MIHRLFFVPIRNLTGPEFSTNYRAENYMDYPNLQNAEQT